MMFRSFALVYAASLSLHCQGLQGSLNPSEKKFGEFLESHKQANPGKPLEERTVEELRLGTSVFMQYVGDAADVSYADRQIATQNGASLTLRIFNEQLLDHAPVLIYYQGNCCFFDIFEINSIICSRIALHSGIKVILVQYRLAPESPMPTSIYDGYDAALYIAKHPEDFGIDPDRILLGGWCSGAHCSAAVSSMARQDQQLKIHHQILLSGRYDLTESNHEFDEWEKEDKTVDRGLLRYITKECYGISAEDYQNPLLSPYYETDFHGMPPTTILCGEYDALRNDSEGYYRKLKEAGVQAEKMILVGQTHNTIMLRKVLSDGVDPAEVIAGVIKSTL